MTSSLFLMVAVLAALLLLFLTSQIWGRYARSGEALQTENGQLTAVDLEAFENLTDPEEEHYLRKNLSAAAFRRVQRTRLRVAKMYVAALWQNAAVLVAVGQSARSSADPATAATGQEIMQRAIRLKIWCLLSLLRMDAALIFPAHVSPSSRLANQYMLVTYIAANLPGRAAA
ncbi:MAG: hypothetical protein WA609_05455 [Terriglobales bacterium]